jgi:hypothetical protein
MGNSRSAAQDGPESLALWRDRPVWVVLAARWQSTGGRWLETNPQARTRLDQRTTEVELFTGESHKRPQKFLDTVRARRTEDSAEPAAQPTVDSLPGSAPTPPEIAPMIVIM